MITCTSHISRHVYILYLGTKKRSGYAQTGSNAPVYILLGLTPTDEGDKDQVFGSNFCKYDDQLLEHEEGLCPHPHHCDEGEVVDQ